MTSLNRRFLCSRPAALVAAGELDLDSYVHALSCNVAGGQAAAPQPSSETASGAGAREHQRAGRRGDVARVPLREGDVRPFNGRLDQSTPAVYRAPRRAAGGAGRGPLDDPPPVSPPPGRSRRAGRAQSHERAGSDPRSAAAPAAGRRAAPGPRERIFRFSHVHSLFFAACFRTRPNDLHKSKTEQRKSSALSVC